MGHEGPMSITIRNTRAGDAPGLERLQEIVFPTLAAEERLGAAHYLKHLELFPQGQFVALDGDRLVGMTSTLRLDFDFDHVEHTFMETIAGGWFTTHQPDGRWLYGADIGTHPEARGRGVGRLLYRARQRLTQALGLEGQVTVGMMSGYGAKKAEMTAEDYYDRLVRGELVDPTCSMQMKVGFEPRGLIRGYLNDPVCDNCGVLLVLPAGKDV